MHQHSGISFVAPGARHEGKDVAILENRKRVYELARQRNPSRWSGQTRSWDRVEEVYLNTKRTSSRAA